MQTFYVLNVSFRCVKPFSLCKTHECLTIKFFFRNTFVLKHYITFIHPRVNIYNITCSTKLHILETGCHDSGHWFKINFLRNLFCLDVLVLIWDQYVSGLGRLPAVLVDPLIHRVLVNEAQQLVQRLFGDVLKQKG